MIKRKAIEFLRDLWISQELIEYPEINEQTSYEDLIDYLKEADAKTKILIQDLTEEWYEERGLRKCHICNEWFEEDDLNDTEGLVNGGLGYVCDQCMEDCDIG
jgi:hypothetical protein